MKLGIVGLGRMGGNIARRLLGHGHEVAAFDLNADAVARLTAEGAEAAGSIEELVRLLPAPRAVWIMLPAGDPTEESVRVLKSLLGGGDVVIDGGNSFYKDDIRRAAELGEKNIDYVDVGTSGGVWGAERGFCMMIGGAKNTVERLDPIFKALAPGAGTIDRTPGRDSRDARVEEGYLHAGPPGAGHFVKMVHNGIEYGLMQAYAEGFDILRGRSSELLAPNERFQFDLPDIAEVWRRGSVVSSWLLDLCAIALAGDPGLDGFAGVVEDSGEGRWAVNAAIEEAVPAHVLTAALFDRFQSRDRNAFSGRILSAMRRQFGGHLEQPAPAPRPE